MTPRSWLIVPADNEEKIAAALGSAADAVIFDLEDSVAASEKARARDILRGLGARTAGGPSRWVRINPLESEFSGPDIGCCEELELDGLVLPKAEEGEQVRRLAMDVMEASWRLHAMVGATPASLFGMDSFIGAAASLTTMSCGIDDLSTALGASSKFDADGSLSFTYRLARSLCLTAARAAGAQPVDGVFRDVTDVERLRREAEAARREGFTGKLAIDPSQVEVINEAFTPTAEEVAAARAIVAAFEAEPRRGSLAVGARLIDRPRLAQARGVLQRAGAAKE
ncbi:HpcH/HpaI aldolase/citrate lyase family protein [Amaricoccus solimangrovi]|uniref:CoA ester lyase n=1 Tax=Amaricoccus solimangrovi TaxID=2589815 RepID=A0A501WKC3_9RHOB|nr:CoA ester lyase [Amaricoccus solimangrovi]TPE47491.1 CoA ester lyase [Amaricoccus solimangrovi]